MLLYDPDSSIYEIDGSRMDLAKEYRDNLRGPFSNELQKILDKMRTTPLEGRLVLIIIKPFQEFGLARLSGKRGIPPNPIKGIKYYSIAEAEWDIFKRRWRELTNIPVTIKDDE
jgi:hypothetical protein